MTNNAMKSVGVGMAVMTLAVCLIYLGVGQSITTELFGLIYRGAASVFDTVQVAHLGVRGAVATAAGASAATGGGVDLDTEKAPWLLVAILCAVVILAGAVLHLRFRRVAHRRLESLAKASSDQGHSPRADLATDIAEYVDFDEAAEDARERKALRDDIKAMNGLMAVVGHELRTPLAALRAMSECLIQGDVDLNSAQAKEFLQAIHDETVRMANLVSNLLEAARLDSGHAKWNWGTLSLNDVIHDAANVLRPLIDPSQVQLHTPCISEEIMMNGDREAITRLLINLLSNSVKHTTRGAIEISARTSYDAQGQTVELTVRDTGAGIPSPVLSKLGYAFATNEGTVSANFARGSGLGLSICRVISSIHGGEISVASEPGLGSTFTARLRADLEGPVEQEVDVVHVRGEAA